MRQRFVGAAEELLRSNGGAQLKLSEVAARLGMSQSNSYRYFPDRRALVSMLAENWFSEVEQETAAAVTAQQHPEAQILSWVLTTMRVKCRSFDADPILFHAYLKLATGEIDTVARHVTRLRDMVRPSMATLVSQAPLEVALDVLEDATMLYRNPYLIAQNRPKLSEARALAVTKAVIRGLR